MTRMNEYHVRRVNLVLDLDAEKDSIKAYERLKRQVPSLEEIAIVRLSGKDPSKLGFVHTHTLIRNAVAQKKSETRNAASSWEDQAVKKLVKHCWKNKVMDPEGVKNAYS